MKFALVHLNLKCKYQKTGQNKKCNRAVEEGEKPLNDLVMVKVEFELGLEDG